MSKIRQITWESNLFLDNYTIVTNKKFLLVIIKNGRFLDLFINGVHTHNEKQIYRWVSGFCVHTHSQRLHDHLGKYLRLSHNVSPTLHPPLHPSASHRGGGLARIVWRVMVARTTTDRWMWRERSQLIHTWRRRDGKWQGNEWGEKWNETSISAFFYSE